MTATPILVKSDIEAMIPHAGGMCLLEQVISFTDEEIVCRTKSHLNADNPLKTDGKLSKMHLIEYGAQAIAVHGGLLERDSDNNEPKLGYIATVKAVKWGEFDPLTEFLEITANSVMRDENSKLYEFFITDAQLRNICFARVMVIHPNSD
jgi:predicted hotdog family 3-hydroxylacyl-ACP dehydratase